MSSPRWVCATSGWNWTPNRPRPASSNAATGVADEVATTRAGGRHGDRVAVGHPDALLRLETVEQLTRREHWTAVRRTRTPRAIDPPPARAGQLRPVADAERRDAHREHGRVDSGRPVRVHRRRPTGEDERCRVAPRSSSTVDRSRRARSRRAPPARVGRSAASTGRRGRRRARGDPPARSRAPARAAAQPRW